MKKLLNKYRELAKIIDKDIRVCKSTYWWSLVEDKKIGIIKAKEEQGDEPFIASIERILPQDKKYLIKTIPTYMWSFVHEIGHIKKGKRINDDFIRTLANTLAKKGFHKIADLIYFNMKEEKLATQWAVNFVIQNEQLVKRYCKKLEAIYR